MTSVEYIQKIELIIRRLQEIELVSILAGNEQDYSDTINYFEFKKSQEWKRYIKNYKFLK